MPPKTKTQAKKFQMDAVKMHVKYSFNWSLTFRYSCSVKTERKKDDPLR